MSSKSWGFASVCWAESKKAGGGDGVTYSFKGRKIFHPTSLNLNLHQRVETETVEAGQPWKNKIAVRNFCFADEEKNFPSAGQRFAAHSKIRPQNEGQ